MGEYALDKRLMRWVIDQGHKCEGVAMEHDNRIAPAVFW
nr:hypothetical protein BAR15_180062 [Bartonella sp. AR 15-3]